MAEVERGKDMYKCLDCNAEFEELDFLAEPHGEVRGHCTCCGSDNVTDGNSCAICGDYTDDVVCERCWKELMTLNNAISVGAELPEKVEINGMYAFYFDKDEINAILEKELSAALRYDCTEDIRDLCSDFFSGSKEEAALLKDL